MTARQSMTSYKAQKKAENAFAGRWAEYEAQKRAWMLTHQEATHREFVAACVQIADRCGVNVA